jgi:hypothetical protein
MFKVVPAGILVDVVTEGDDAPARPAANHTTGDNARVAARSDVTVLREKAKEVFDGFRFVGFIV